MAEKKLSGGCLCGKVRYEATGEPMTTAQCFCRDCQRATGSGHNAAAAYPADAVKVTGELKAYTSNGDSGQPITRSFCPNCGSLIMGKPSVAPQMTILTLGTFDDPNVFETIGMAFYTKRKNAWDHVHPKAVAFEANPPPRG